VCFRNLAILFHLRLFESSTNISITILYRTLCHMSCATRSTMCYQDFSAGKANKQPFGNVHFWTVLLPLSCCTKLCSSLFSLLLSHQVLLIFLFISSVQHTFTAFSGSSTHSCQSSTFFDLYIRSSFTMRTTSFVALAVSCATSVYGLPLLGLGGDNVRLLSSVISLEVLMFISTGCFGQYQC